MATLNLVCRVKVSNQKLPLLINELTIGIDLSIFTHLRNYNPMNKLPVVIETNILSYF